MKTLTLKQKIAAVLIALASALLGGAGATQLGSVEVGSEYFATSTRSFVTGHNIVATSGPAVLGSIVVASSSATTITIWNASSKTDSASTTFVALKASIAEGTYTFDMVLPRGLIVEEPTGFNGDYTITYRPQ